MEEERWKFLDEEKPKPDVVYLVKWNDDDVRSAMLVYDYNGRDYYFEDMYGNSITGHAAYTESKEDSK